MMIYNHVYNCDLVSKIIKSAQLLSIRFNGIWMLIYKLLSSNLSTVSVDKLENDKFENIVNCLN